MQVIVRRDPQEPQYRIPGRLSKPQAGHFMNESPELKRGRFQSALQKN